MAAGDVAQFMGDHALHFLGAVGGVDQPRMEVDRLSARDESVDRRIVDQHDVDIVLLEARSLDQRGGNLVEKGLGLGVAQHALRCGRLNRERQRGDACGKACGGACRHAAQSVQERRHFHPMFSPPALNLR